ncbi:MAG: superoxide dismutase [Candidatus Melainabacteria bacterium]|nr:superoxide dismutase [Candidatus Melainabacteria bacterium]
MTRENENLIGNFEVTKNGLVTRREILMMGAMAASVGQLIGTGANATSVEAAATGAATGKGTADAPYVAKDFNTLAGTLDGLSASQIKQHLKLYTGYVDKANAISKSLKDVDLTTANATYSAVRELLIEQSFAVNGVVYHEFYFGNLGKKGDGPTGNLKAAIDDRWGSQAKFVDFLKAAGKSARGWVIIGWNTRSGTLDAFALDTHNIFSPANIVPVLVLDVYEHAYMIDYGVDRPKYLDAFLGNLNWEVVSRRFAAASKHPSGWDATI